MNKHLIPVPKPVSAGVLPGGQLQAGAVVRLPSIALRVTAVGPLAHSQGWGPVEFRAVLLEPSPTVKAGDMVSTPWGMCEIESMWTASNSEALPSSG